MCYIPTFPNIKIQKVLKIYEPFLDKESTFCTKIATSEMIINVLIDSPIGVRTSSKVPKNIFINAKLLRNGAGKVSLSKSYRHQLQHFWDLSSASPKTIGGALVMSPKNLTLSVKLSLKRATTASKTALQWHNIVSKFSQTSFFQKNTVTRSLMRRKSIMGVHWDTKWWIFEKRAINIHGKTWILGDKAKGNCNKKAKHPDSITKSCRNYPKHGDWILKYWEDTVCVLWGDNYIENLFSVLKDCFGRMHYLF